MLSVSYPESLVRIFFFFNDPQDLANCNKYLKKN